MTETVEVARISSLNAQERETIINASDSDGLVTIWTAQKKWITKLRRNKSYTETRSGFYGTTAWAEFTIPINNWNPATGAKRQGRTLTEEQRVLQTQRLAEMRQRRTE